MDGSKVARRCQTEQACIPSDDGIGDRPIRIVRVIARLNVGGPAVYTISLAAGLDPAHFEQWLITGVAASHEGDMLADASAKGIKPIVLPHLGRAIDPRDDIHSLATLVSLFRRIRPDIVETHTAKAGILGRIAAWVAGVPTTLHTFHGHVFHGYFSPVRSTIVRRVEQLLALRTTRIIALGPDQRSEILEYGVGRPEQVVSMPIGLDLKPYLASERDRGRLRAELGISSDTRLVGIVARLTAIKAHEVFLQVAAAVRQQLADTQFIVVGAGERQSELVQLADQYGIGSMIHWLGWRRDLPLIYGDLDVVTLTSRNEGLPTTLVEAMASGCPVVATRVGSVPTLVTHGKNGLLADVGDTTALAASVVALLKNPQLANRLGQASRQSVYPYYDLSAFLPRMAELYRRLANRGHR